MRFRAILRSCLIFLLCLLTACGPTPQPSGGENDTTAPAITTEALMTDIVLAENGETQYRIVRAEMAHQRVAEAAVALADRIEEISGARMQLTTDWEHESMPETMATEYEIILGETNRSGKYFTCDTDQLGCCDFLITVIDRRIVIIGGSVLATVQGAEYFMTHCLPEAKTPTLTLDVETQILEAREKSDRLIVMSQNLLATDTEYETNPNNAQHLIKLRQSRIASIFLDHLPDSIGLQECSSPWRSYFDGMRNLWTYSRVAADKNPKVSILYNTDTLKLISSGSIWLTEEPETLKISREWKGTTERLAHHAVFEVIATGQRYVHVNTHIGFDNDAVAMGQAKVVRDYCDRLHSETGYPVVCTGDFNFTMSSPCYVAFAEGIMGDTKLLATGSSTGTGSFNKMGHEGYPKAEPIDQVMVSRDDWDVYTYAVDYTTFDGWYASDHYAVVAEIKLRA